MIVVATQIKLKSLFRLFAFVRFASAVKAQLRQSEGLLFSEFRADRTLSGWADWESMKRFRNSGAHLEAMKHTRALGRAKSVAWESPEKPGWAEAKARLDEIEW